MIEISTDKNRLDLRLIYGFLTQAYWAKGRTIQEVQKTIDHSFCFGIYLNKKQIGFARVVTDRTVFAHLMDVFILEPERNKGYAKKLLKAVFDHPELVTCKKWTLKTLDAQGMYKEFGFVPKTKTLMERNLAK